MIDANYLDGVGGGFRMLGAEEYEACAPSLSPGRLPVVALTRHATLEPLLRSRCPAGLRPLNCRFTSGRRM